MRTKNQTYYLFFSNLFFDEKNDRDWNHTIDHLFKGIQELDIAEDEIIRDIWVRLFQEKRYTQSQVRRNALILRITKFVSTLPLNRLSFLFEAVLESAYAFPNEDFTYILNLIKKYNLTHEYIKKTIGALRKDFDSGFKRKEQLSTILTTLLKEHLSFILPNLFKASFGEETLELLLLTIADNVLVGSNDHVPNEFEKAILSCLAKAVFGDIHSESDVPELISEKIERLKKEHGLSNEVVETLKLAAANYEPEKRKIEIEDEKEMEIVIPLRKAENEPLQNTTEKAKQAEIPARLKIIGNVKKKWDTLQSFSSEIQAPLSEEHVNELFPKDAEKIEVLQYALEALSEKNSGENTQHLERQRLAAIMLISMFYSRPEVFGQYGIKMPVYALLHHLIFIFSVHFQEDINTKILDVLRHYVKGSQDLLMRSLQKVIFPTGMNSISETRLFYNAFFSSIRSSSTQEDATEFPLARLLSSKESINEFLLSGEQQHEMAAFKVNSEDQMEEAVLKHIRSRNPKQEVRRKSVTDWAELAHSLLSIQRTQIFEVDPNILAFARGFISYYAQEIPEVLGESLQRDPEQLVELLIFSKVIKDPLNESFKNLHLALARKVLEQQPRSDAAQVLRAAFLAKGQTQGKLPEEIPPQLLKKPALNFIGTCLDLLRGRNRTNR